MRLGDYADGAWMFIATCDTCGRQTRVDPAEVLTHPRTHPHMRVAELAIRLRCLDCRHRTARIDPVARLPKQPFVAPALSGLPPPHRADRPRRPPAQAAVCPG